MTLNTGEVLENRYRIVRLLGQGGFGAVYRAWDMKLSGPCAVKENTENTPAAQTQFAREASLLFNLDHPNLPKVFDTFSIPGKGQYLVMQYIEGEDLQTMLDRGEDLSEARVIPWILQVCDALAYLHSRTPAVIHRDIKPANIRITREGRAYLVDFGISKVYDPQLRTTMGARAVTPGYSPPEQYGRGTTDAQSDIYSLGATLYTLLTHQVPPDSVDIVACSVAPPKPAHEINPAISLPVSKAIEGAMQVSRTARFASIAEFRAALTAVPQPSPPAPAPAPPIPPTQVVQQGSQPTPISSPATSPGNVGTSSLPLSQQALTAAPPARMSSKDKWVIAILILISLITSHLYFRESIEVGIAMILLLVRPKPRQALAISAIYGLATSFIFLYDQLLYEINIFETIEVLLPMIAWNMIAGSGTAVFLEKTGDMRIGKVSLKTLSGFAVFYCMYSIYYIYYIYLVTMVLDYGILIFILVKIIISLILYLPFKWLYQRQLTQ